MVAGGCSSSVRRSVSCWDGWHLRVGELSQTMCSRTPYGGFRRLRRARRFRATSTGCAVWSDPTGFRVTAVDIA